MDKTGNRVTYKVGAVLGGVQFGGGRIKELGDEISVNGEDGEDGERILSKLPPTFS